MRLAVVDFVSLILVVAIHLLPEAAFANNSGRLDFLEKEIARHDRAYYRDNAASISDIEYDALQDQRVALAKDSMPKEVGDDRLSGFTKSPHLSRMLSLKKTHGVAGLEDFYDRVVRTTEETRPVLIVEPKVDGIAVNLIYKKGVLEKVLTRGNGFEGNVITRSIQNIADLPVRLNRLPVENGEFPDRMEIRGEVYVEKEAFQRMNRLLEKAGQSPYSTTRSMAAGLSRSSEYALSGEFLRLVVFDWGIWQTTSRRPSSYSEFSNLAKSWGFRVLESGVSVSSREELLAVVENQLKICRTLPVPCDGVVVKLDDTRSREVLGRTERAPNWAIACKFPAQTGSTTISDIQLKMGRTGYFTPVAKLIPVEINRRQITSMNLNSPSFVKAMDVRVGDRVIVALSGDVIPVLKKVEIDYRTAGSAPFAIPKLCPFCQSLLDGKSGENNLRCPNYTCSERLKRRFEHFAEKLGLAGLGPATIEELVECCNVCTYSELLNQYCHDNSRALDPEIWQVLAGLGISNLGIVSARKLAVQLGCLEDFLNMDSDMFRSAELPERVLRSIEQYNSNPETGGELRDLIKWFDSNNPRSMCSNQDKS